MEAVQYVVAIGEHNQRKRQVGVLDALLVSRVLHAIPVARDRDGCAVAPTLERHIVPQHTPGQFLDPSALTERDHVTHHIIAILIAVVAIHSTRRHHICYHGVWALFI